MHFFHVLFTQKLFSATGFEVAGCLSCSLPAAGRSPKVCPSCSLSAVPGLDSIGPVSTQSFPSYCFLDSLLLHQLFISLCLPFLREVCPSHRLPSPILPAIQVSALLPYLFHIPPAATYQALLLASTASKELTAHSPCFEHHCVKKEPS